MDWVSLGKELGPYLSLMLFFIWRDFRREERMEKQINSLNEFIRTELMSLIEKTNGALRGRE